MKVVVFASGSKGNLTYIETPKTKILIDAGVRYRSLKAKVDEKKVDIDEIDAILITHEHSDHIAGLKLLVKNHNIKKIYATKGTFDQIEELLEDFKGIREVISADQTFVINDLRVHTVMLSHDAEEPVGFVFERENKKVVLLTDTGYVDRSYYDLLSNANLYILESNHNLEMLMKSRRPMYLKQRIVSEQGHLSNEDAAWLINRLISKNHQAIWVAAHISEDCNTKFEIEKALVSVIDNPLKVDLKFSSQETMKEIILW